MTENGGDTARGGVEATTPVLDMSNVTILAGPRKRLRLVSDVTLRIGEGEVVALVGESGSGKSISALACVGLLPAGLSVVGGSIRLAGQVIESLPENQLRRLRGPHVAMVFQDPMTNLDPCFTIGSQLIETVRAHRSATRREAEELALEMLEIVEIPNAAARLHSFPHELSGGMRQRVMIAGALILRPKLLIADEPTTALDVTTQAAIVDLVGRLQRDLGMAMLWISHDLGVVARVSDRVAVMYAGEIIEEAATADLFQHPMHPYTQGLIASATPRDAGERFNYIPGRVPHPGTWPEGCRFAPRCARVHEVCSSPLALRAFGPSHVHRCVLPGELPDAGGPREDDR